MDGQPYLEIQLVKVAQQCSIKTGFRQITLILAKTLTIWLQTEVWILSTICRFLNCRIVYWQQIQNLIQDHGALPWFHNKIILMTAPHLSRTFTGKSFSEALILASVNPQYDKIQVKVQRADLTCDVTSFRVRWFEPQPIRDEYSNFAGA